MIYSWCVRQVRDREEFDTLLNEPLPGMESRATPVQARKEMDDFMAFTTQVTGGAQ